MTGGMVSTAVMVVRRGGSAVVAMVVRVSMVVRAVRVAGVVFSWVVVAMVVLVGRRCRCRGPVVWGVGVAIPGWCRWRVSVVRVVLVGLVVLIAV